MTAPIAKRADELAIGDRIQPGFLPAYARSGEGTVRYLETYHYQGADWVFAAFACADGDRNCAYYLPGGMLKVVPADTGLGYSRADDGETTQPIAGRVPAHYGAVEAAGGLVDIDPPATCSVCGESVQRFLWDSHAYRHGDEVVWPVANSEQP